MFTKFAPSYAYLRVGYLEEIIVILRLFSSHFRLASCKLIEEIFKRFMDDKFFYGQKMPLLMYLQKFLMNYFPH